MSYDPKNDVIEIALEGLNHTIHKPQKIFVERQGLELSNLEVINGDNVRQIIVLEIRRCYRRPPPRWPSEQSIRARQLLVRGASAMDVVIARVVLLVHHVQNFPDTWSHSQVKIIAPISPSARRTAAHTKAELKFASWNRQ
jgi:hypothetical protein